MSSRNCLVVVLPGIGGSVLADESGAEIWKADAATGVGRILDPSALDIDRSLHATRLISSYAAGPWQLITGYASLMAGLTGALRLTKAEVATAGRRLVKPDASLVAFPYDFRQSVETNALALDAEIRRRAQGRSVVLVAHSMGGLVAACWWANLAQGIDVAEIITLGTPYRGATKALEWLVNGVKVGPVCFSTATRVLRGWPSVADLLPHWRVAETPDGRSLRPHEIALTAPGLEGFAERALAAYTANRALHDALGSRIAELGNPLALYYSRGHGTLSRARVAGGVLTTAKCDPAWLPAGWGQGDGTVPMLSAIPPALEDRPRAWHRVALKHGELVEAEAVAGHVAGYGLGPLPPAARIGRDRAQQTFVCLDLDEVVPAGQPQTVRVTLEGRAPTATSVHLEFGGRRIRAQGEGGAWSVELPPLPEGTHRFTVVARGVPGEDRIRLRGRVGAVPCRAD